MIIPHRTTHNTRDEHIADHNAFADAYNSVIRITSPYGSAGQNLTALQEAIAEAKHGGNYGGTVLVAPGDYVLTDTFEIRGHYGLRFAGIGTATNFVWAGASDKPVFKVVKSRECQFSNFRTTTETEAYAALQILRDSGSGFSPTHNRFSGLLIECSNKSNNAIVIGGTGAVDANNDFHLFEHCTLSGYTDIGVNMSGSQAYNQQFVNCSLWGGTGAQYGYRTGKVGASIHVMGGGVNAHAAADFYIGRSYQPYVIRFVNSENSGRFIEAPNEAYRQLIVEGCRWSGGGLHEDGRAIVTSGLIQMELRYCSIGDGNNPTRALTLDFASTGAASGGGVIMEGCRIFSSADDVFPNDAPTRIENCTQITDEVAETMVALTA